MAAVGNTFINRENSYIALAILKNYTIQQSIKKVFCIFRAPIIFLLTFILNIIVLDFD